MTTIEIFEEIFWQVGEEFGLTTWWEIFDSEAFEIVETRIAKQFGVSEVTEIEGYTEWYNEMAEEL